MAVTVVSRVAVAELTSATSRALRVLRALGAPPTAASCPPVRVVSPKSRGASRSATKRVPGSSTAGDKAIAKAKTA